ncbi:MAG: group II intron reverse transcriptase/maturase [Acidobacteria bacterium]|nr:group II intron reverse transcriptase/maturase [Acidobacteriota bacterium]
MKQPNNEGRSQRGQPSAEAVEGSALTKENTEQPNAGRTQSRETVSSGLSRVRQAALGGKQKQFTALLHHLTVDLLRESYYALQRAAAPGVDGVRWKEYEAGLEQRLKELHGRVHRGAYRAQPSRRVYIPKADGRQRPLGIAALEDKIVQQAVVAVLNQIYEVDFRGFSYGFRPGRSPHQALDALSVGLTRKKVNWVLDADIRGFFDNIDHEWMVQFLQHRIADTRLLRLIQKWLRAGISEDGEWSETKVGTPQGAVISPLLANVYLHYVFDLWVEAWRNKNARGDVIVIRYADDFVTGFEERADAERFLEDLRERLARFGLELHAEKTRLIEFGRFAASNRKERGKGKPETFDFLGFTHICGKNRRTGRFEVRRKTVGKRLAKKLRDIKQQLRRRMHEPPARTGEWLRSVVRGYFNYHAIPGNRRSLCAFRSGAARHWRQVLRRRGQKARLNWARMTQLIRCYIPTARLVHPYPSVRFDAMHPR